MTSVGAYKSITEGGPWFIMRPDTKELLCNTNRLKPSFWGKQWLGARNFRVKQSGYSAVAVARKQFGEFDYEFVTEEEIKAAWRKEQAATAPPAPLREPELLTVDEQEREPSAFASSPLPPAPPELEPEPDPVQNELLMNAMATEHALIIEEAAAYEMWQVARVKLRNHKKQREFLENSCKCVRKP